MRVIKKIFFLLLFSIFYSQLYSQDNIHDFLERLSKGNYVIDFYCDVLKSGKRETIHKFSDVYIDREYPDPDYGKVKYKWFDMNVFPMEIIQIKTNEYSEEIEDGFFSISNHWIDVDNFCVEKNIEIIFSEGSDLNDWYDNYSSLDWKKVREKKQNTFYFHFDGDYLYIYLNEEKEDSLFATFVNLNDETFKEFKNLIKNNTCDLSRVTWPRHADGTCDYDDSKTITTQTSKEVFSSNVAKNKIMTVTENLKLRSAEATTSKVLTVMAAGTKVKILEIGKAETIDGIDSNWVKVEVQKGAKGHDCKEIKAGTVGWCYGGYLEETKQNDDKQTVKKDEKKKKKK